MPDYYCEIREAPDGGIYIRSNHPAFLEAFLRHVPEVAHNATCRRWIEELGAWYISPQFAMITRIDKQLCVDEEEERKAVKDHCYITKCKTGGVYLEAPYDEDFLDALKRHVPAGERRWEPDQKRWWVSEKYAGQAAADARAKFNRVIEVP